MMSSQRVTGFDSPPESPLEPSHRLDVLETLLQSRLVGRIQEFRLEVRGSGLVLRGCARTYYAKQLAQHAVMDATNLPILANAIAVS